MNAATLPPSRFEQLDALRGLAMVWMMVFHFCFDLNLNGLLSPKQNFYADPFWIWQRTAIVSLFVFSAGFSQALALTQGQGWPRFWRRWAQVAGCAVLVSLGSAWMFPNSWISFGVLHGMAVMLVLVRLAWPMRRGLWLLALVALVLPFVWHHAAFNGRWLNWTGLVTKLPVTEDYVPVLPWLGVMLIGAAGGRWVLAERATWLMPAATGPLRGLALLGRWPLTVYMLHQPLFLGLIELHKLWR